MHECHSDVDLYKTRQCRIAGGMPITDKNVIHRMVYGSTGEIVDKIPYHAFGSGL